MSDFWDKNKGSIKSGLLTAGKYGYQGTKYVAKTGYQVGKNQYNANKAKRDGKTNPDSSERGEATSIDKLNDPNNFPAPPLRQGQKQYVGNGQVVSAEDAPILNTPPAAQTPNQQMTPVGYQYQNQQGYFNQQYSTAGPAQYQTMQQQPMQQQHMQQQPIQQAIEQQGTNSQSQPIQEQGMMQQQPIQQQPFQQQQQPFQQQQQPFQQQQQPFQQQQQPFQQQQQPFQQSGISGGTPPQIPSRLPTSSQTQANQSQNSIVLGSSEPSSSLPPSTGPLFEVKPFNREEYEENKNQKKIALPDVDLTKVAPPPTHRDRSSNESSTRNSPSLKPSYLGTNSNSRSTSDLPGPTLTQRPVSKVPNIQPSGSNIQQEESISVGNSSKTGMNNQQQNIDKAGERKDEEGEGQEEVKPGITGIYQEPVSNFAPPPKPHKNVEGDKQQSSYNHYSQNKPSSNEKFNTTACQQPPPVLPKRSTNTSLETSSFDRPSSHTSSIDKSQGKETSVQSPVTGVYTPQSVNFQPPPRPFRRQEDTPQDRSMGRRSTSNSFTSQPAYVQQLTSSTYQKTSVLGYTEAEDRRIPRESPTIEETTKTVFLPPPKPFRRQTEEMANRPTNSAAGRHESIQTYKGSNDDIVDEAPPPLPPHPIMDPDYCNSPYEHDKYLQRQNEEVDYSFQSPLLSVANKSADSDFLKDLNSSISTLSLEKSGKPKKNRPPVVKPKPKNLSNISLNTRSDISDPNKHSFKDKKPPPLVKPKPKNINNMFDRGDNSTVSLTSATGQSSKPTPARGGPRAQHLIHRSQPPIPDTSNNMKLHPTRRGRMPLPHELNKNTDNNRDNNAVDTEEAHDDDVNPFSIYKKDAVPSSSNRIRRD